MIAQIRLGPALILCALCFLLVDTVGVALANPAWGASSSWVQLFPASPPAPRYNQAMVYDEASSQVVLFGGYGATCCGTIFGDTWVWDGASWRQKFRTGSPPARGDAAMAYDPRTQTVVLFGGHGTGGTLGDTWILNWNGWQQVFPPVAPRPRERAQMVYDRATRSIVLFGGVGFSGPLGDTWTWQGGTWTIKQSINLPPDPINYGLAYDSARHRVVLFGGANPNSQILDQTWTWDGVNWTNQTSAVAPSPREAAAMTDDARLHLVVLFGGVVREPGGTVYGDTWTWNGKVWRRLVTSTLPPPRFGARIVYDNATHSAVLFGGCAGVPKCTTLLNDTWVLQTED